ncbi:MAG TPA: nicotinate phosphoribosyltransferase, partial [Actinomycetota bacterium]|nr:nicotinate phosphoribosyltransferase [Actinomycetota bacterium]
FASTSNVEAARAVGLRATGTMAHSYVEAFPSELEAFRAFSEDFADRVVLLVDTYDTERGVEKAIDVARALRDHGVELRGIRLDSGDLGALAKEARATLDAAGFDAGQIFASGALDEHVIAALEREGAPIDAYGVGTKVGVSADAPYLDSVYKLVEYAGRRVAKLSPEKATLPGPKQVWRGRAFDEDVITLRDEDGPEGARPLLERVVTDGRRVGDTDLGAARGRFEEDLGALPKELRTLEPGPYPIRRSDELLRRSDEVRDEIRRRELD